MPDPEAADAARGRKARLRVITRILARAIALATLLGIEGVTCAVAEAAEALVVDAGPLRAELTRDPWHLAFTTSDRRPVLDEAPVASTELAGPIGFRTTTGWAHATRVVSARRHGR